jgi:hypothetical protein
MKSEKEYNLSLDEVKEIAGRKGVHLVSADNKLSLKKIFNKGLDTGRDQYVIIHYQTGNDENSRYGHWVGMIIKPKTKMIYYMDSYGIYPDDELDYIPYEYRKETGQLNRDVGIFLYRAINEFGYRVRYNDDKLQASGDNIGTCGRYVGLFLRTKVEPEVFASLIRTKEESMRLKSPDDVIVAMTREII